MTFSNTSLQHAELQVSLKLPRLLRCEQLGLQQHPIPSGKRLACSSASVPRAASGCLVLLPAALPGSLPELGLCCLSPSE